MEMAKIRKQHSSKMKLEAAIAMISGKSPVSEFSQKYGVHPGALQRWIAELLEGRVDIFSRRKKRTEDGPTVDDLQRKICQLTMDLDFLKKALGK
jgi:transposase-like protein